jgi:hypothetical protein
MLKERLDAKSIQPIGGGEMHGELKLAFRQAKRLSSISELLIGKNLIKS